MLSCSLSLAISPDKNNFMFTTRDLGNQTDSACVCSIAAAHTNARLSEVTDVLTESFLAHRKLEYSFDK